MDLDCTCYVFLWLWKLSSNVIAVCPPEAMCSEALATDGESPGGLSAKKKQRLFREKVDKSARHKFGHQDNIPQVEESSCAMRPIPSQLDMGSDLLSQRDDDGGGVPDIPLPEYVA